MRESLEAGAYKRSDFNPVTTLQCGCFAGALAASPVADRLGRKFALYVSAVLAVVGTVMQLAASGYIEVIYTGRLVAGVGVGAASMVVPLYGEQEQEYLCSRLRDADAAAVSENAPRAIRGGLTGFYQLFIVTGIMIAFWRKPISPRLG